MIPFAEPITTLTDYAIALESFLFSGILLCHPVMRSQAAVRLWGAAFFCVAVAAIWGGTLHGFFHQLEPATASTLWHGMIAALGFTSFFMLTGTAFNSAGPRWRCWLLLLAGTKLLVYLVGTRSNGHFAYAIADYLIAMLLVLIVLQRFPYRKNPGARWITAGIVVAIAATAVEATGYTPALGITHNDIYHLILMLALYLLYRGASLLKDHP